MFISDIDIIKALVVNDPKAKGASMKSLIGGDEGWDSHVMRVVEIEAEGYSPKHSHPWPHINYIIEGEGSLFSKGEEKPIKKGIIAFISSGEIHQFKNTGKEKLVFICIVPKEGHIT